MLKYLVIVGALVQLVGVASYIKETIKGNTKPNRVSWLMWSLAPLIGSAAALSGGATWVVLPVFMSGFGPLLVFIASFINKNSYWKLEKFDYLCGIFSLLALVLWGITKEPLIAIFLAIASDGLAAVPTVKKSWNHPETETITPYATGLINTSTSFFAIKSWVLIEYAFPVYLLIMDIILVLAVSRKRFNARNRPGHTF